MIDHSPLDRSHVDVSIVRQRLLVSVWSPTILLVAWLIEVGLRNQDQRLDGDQYLGGGRGGDDSPARIKAQCGYLKKA